MIHRHVFSRFHRPSSQRRRWDLLTVLALFTPSVCSGLACSARHHAVSSQTALNPPDDWAHNLLGTTDFSDGVMLPWMTSFTDPARGNAEITGGALCLHVESPGANRWDAQVRHRGMTIEQGHTYHLAFTIWSSRATQVTGKIGMSGAPYTDYWTRKLELTPEPRRHSFDFTMSHPDDATAELAFHAGGHLVEGTDPVTVCLDEVVLSDPKFTPSPPAEVVSLPLIRLNQVGFAPWSPKRAILVSDATEPQQWELFDAENRVLIRGETIVVGPDASSGDPVHVLDFSAAKQPGSALRLRSGGHESDPFSIALGLYDPLAVDALRFFYHNRSGAPIEMPYARERRWARPAGHAPDRATCAPGTGCTYTLDVTGGWYDAGDQGKYVVNGGLSVWLLLNAVERTKHLSRPSPLFADGALEIPESGNGVPDILDEARWELEFLLKMQVPDGSPLAGMAHHKIHDDAWTALGTAPHEDQQTRLLRPPSTAATLNLAAVAAQAARVFQAIDPEFSHRCLVAARRAWTAARAHPSLLAPLSDTQGGGAYGDNVVADEFYWAAAELFVTTGDDDFRAWLDDSELDPTITMIRGRSGVGVEGCLITWDRLDVVAKITLASIPSQFPAKRVSGYQKQLQDAAAAITETITSEGYRVPMAPKAGKIPWGSNAWVLGNMVLLGAAADFPGGVTYAHGVVDGMDYLLGRNAMAQSYVTGYGARPLQHPHHRFWAEQADAAYPPPPPGLVSGGPNSDLQDPYVVAAGLKGCPPHKCFIDHIEAYSVNEVAINWNAALAWSAAWLAERERTDE